MTPIIILCGQAGSGKDSLGAAIASNYGGVCVAQADPLKWMAQKFFGFTDDQLFGPSSSRNEIDSRFSSEDVLEEADKKVSLFGPFWCRELYGDSSNQGNLCRWFNTVKVKALKSGGLSARYVLQTLGTEWGRRWDPQVWVKYALRNAEQLLCGGFRYERITSKIPADPECTRYTGMVEDSGARPPNLVVITDGRFRNEIIEVSKVGGLAINVRRPTNETAAAQKAGIAGHSSETELEGVPPHLYDYIVANNETLDQLVLKADFVAQQVIKAPRVI